MATDESMSVKAPGGNVSLWAWTWLRILLGWSFLWGFLDKFFGLGFSTCRGDAGAIDFFCDSAMINGGSPTYGFLKFATAGSHTGGLFDWMASADGATIGFADIGFMAALLFGGLALMLGIGVKLAGIGSAILMFFMFLAGDVWPENNPVNSSHIIEMVAFVGIAYAPPTFWSLQGWFSNKFPQLSWVK